MEKSIDKNITKKVNSKSKLLSIVGVSVPFISGILCGFNNMDKNMVHYFASAGILCVSGPLYSIGDSLERNDYFNKFGYFTKATGITAGSASLGYAIGYIAHNLPINN